MDIDSLLREILATRLVKERFEVWIADLRFVVDESQSTLCVVAQTSFIADFVRKTFQHDIAAAVFELFGKAIPLQILAQDAAKGTEKTKTPNIIAQKEDTGKMRVSAGDASVAVVEPKASLLFEPVKDAGYNTVAKLPPVVSTRGGRLQQDRIFATFDDFVSGQSNRLARGIADLVIADPAKINPVFVHGGTSVGKTHFLEAIWSEFRKRHSKRPPLFMTAEQFTTHFVQGLPKDRGQSFRSRFKNISLLIVDDIHFLQGKSATQTELITLIDELRTRQIQMIFSADRPMAELGNLRSELLSRLDGGIVCPVQSPERDTLLKIFRQMAVKRQLDIPEEVSRFVISRFTTHARQLSGVLNRLYATSLSTGSPISLSMANEVLGDLMQSNRRNLRLEDIENAVVEIFGLDNNSLRCDSRSRAVAHPRMLAMYLARKYTRCALSEIGRFFGRSHSTVAVAQTRIDRMIADDAEAKPQNGAMTVTEAIRRAERLLRI